MFVENKLKYPCHLARIDNCKGTLCSRQVGVILAESQTTSVRHHDECDK